MLQFFWRYKNWFSREGAEDSFAFDFEKFTWALRDSGMKKTSVSSSVIERNYENVK